MRCKGKACEIVGEKEVFGPRIAWIRLMEDKSFHEVRPVASSVVCFSQHFAHNNVFTKLGV